MGFFFAVQSLWNCQCWFCIGAAAAILPRRHVLANRKARLASASAQQPKNKSCHFACFAGRHLFGVPASVQEQFSPQSLFGCCRKMHAVCKKRALSHCRWRDIIAAKGLLYQLFYDYIIERSGIHDKTQRSAAPCKASRLRRLHGVSIVAK